MHVELWKLSRDTHVSFMPWDWTSQR